MDFSALNTKAAAEKGAFLHLKHPAFKTPLWDGEGKDRTAVGVTLRGLESKTVQDRVKRLQKERMADGSPTDAGDGLDFVVSLVIGFTGCDREGVPLDGKSEDDVRWFFGLSDGLVEQVIEFARERANFFKDAVTA
jgi:hypothetical protein